ncbi:hypothetical protein [Paenibacillus sp. URB8-2]|uniref:hypothetical protein n=1 Tax=Paenibacillus sp. URB8-2 TaxID=2741301 RepID=UPI0015BE807D|nr:hypothetical protein [Paenibacillus sp. URB8-2]BCG57857.1 hypothetical protein PUR_12820 [Paenibacillus sp. URB8-2]
MKRISNILIIFILLASILAEPTSVKAAETSASVAIPVNTGLVGDDNAVKSYTLDLPSGVSAASINTNSLKYTGNNTLDGSITVENGKIRLKLKGVANTKTLTNLVGYQSSFEEEFFTNPSNSIWRYSDGVRWQINEYSEASDSLISKDVPAEDSSIPSDHPPRTIVSAAPMQDTNYLKWYDGAKTKVIDSKYVIPSTIKPVWDDKKSSNTIKEPPKFKNGKVIVNYAIPWYVVTAGPDAGKIRLQTYENVSDEATHPLVGHAQGREFKVNVFYYYIADAKVPTYSYSGSISFNYSPITEPTLDGSVIVVQPNPNPTKGDGSDVSVTLKVNGELLAFTDSSNIEEWIFYAKESGSSDVKMKKDYGKVQTSSRTFDDFKIPKAKFASGEYEQEYTLTVTVRFSKPLISAGGDIPSITKTMKAKVGVYTGPQPSYMPDPPPTLPSGKPPVAVLDVPDTVVAGENFTISGGGSYDPDGTIKSYVWDTPAVVDAISGKYGETKYPLSAIGTTQTVVLEVVDNDGLSGVTSKKIDVVAPVPQAKVEVRGSLKQNRRVTLHNASRNEADAFPLVESKTKFTVVPISGGSASDIKYSGSLSGVNDKDILFRQPGTYRATITVENTAGYTGTSSTTFVIVPDETPTALISVPREAYRDPGNGNKASATIDDLSFSPDYDYLARRLWEYRYDSNNNGSFDDESWVILSNDNENRLTFMPTQVGRYEIKLTVFEEFGQPTIDEFVTDADRRSADSGTQNSIEKIITVYNRAPVTDWTW